MTKQRETRERVLELIEPLGVGDAIPSERQLGTDLGVSRLTVRAALDELVREGYLVRRRGVIVNLASTAGLQGSTLLGPYSASKGAIVLMTRSMALNHAVDGVRVNCLCPGAIDTPMLAATIASGATPATQAELKRESLRRQPLGRFGRPEEVARAALYLASDAASFVTGVALPVDGGRVA